MNPFNISREIQLSPIESLSTELLEHIFEYVNDTSPSTLLCLTYMNDRFHRSAFRLRNRHHTFTFRDVNDVHRLSEKTAALINDLLTESYHAVEIRRSIRSVTVVFPCDTNSLRQGGGNVVVTELEAEIWGPFIEVIKKLPSLKTLTFHGPGQLPTLLLAALEDYHPKARLHVRNWARDQDDDDDQVEAELALARSPNLRSIQVKLLDCSVVPDLRMAALKRIIALSPHLEYVDIASGARAFMTRRTWQEEHNETQQKAKLFEVEPSANTVRSLKSRGGNHVDDLESVINLSKLESLDVDQITETFFMKDGIPNARFEQLKHLSVELVRPRVAGQAPAVEDMLKDTVAEFLSSCKPLESLEIRSRGHPLKLSAILPYHGKTLRKLTLRDNESGHISHPKAGLTLAEAREMGRCCPLLEEICIDAIKSPSSKSYQEHFAILAAYPKLSTVSIIVPLDIAKKTIYTPTISFFEPHIRIEDEVHKNNPFDPLHNPNWLENTWAVLQHEKRKNGTPQLRELHVEVGNWEQQQAMDVGNQEGHPARWILFHPSNRKHYTVRPSIRDDLPNEILVEVRKWGQGYGHVARSMDEAQPVHEVRRVEVRRVPVLYQQ